MRSDHGNGFGNGFELPEMPALAPYEQSVSPETVAEVPLAGLFLSPNLNAYAERFVRSIKEECLGRMIFFGEKMFREAVQQYASHYHRERNHQGLGNKLIQPDESIGSANGPIECRERLGGLLKYYHRRAA